MSKEMALSDFITTVKRIPEKAQGEASREAYIKKTIINKDHVGILPCKVAAKEIVAVSAFDKNGNYVSDGVKYHLMYIGKVLETFTSLKIQPENFWIEYDRMVEADLLDLILGCIPEKELEQFNMVVEMVLADAKQNYFNSQAVINRNLSVFSPVIHQFIDWAEKTLDNLDEKKIMEAFKNLQ